MKENIFTENTWVVSTKDIRPNHKLHKSYQGQSFKYVSVAALLLSKRGRFLWIILSHLFAEFSFKSLKAPVQTVSLN